MSSHQLQNSSFFTQYENSTSYRLDCGEQINITIFNAEGFILEVTNNGNISAFRIISDYVYDYYISIDELPIGENILTLKIYKPIPHKPLELMESLKLIIYIEPPINNNLIALIIALSLLLLSLLTYIGVQMHNKSIITGFNKSFLGTNSIGEPVLFNITEDLSMVSKKREFRMQRLIMSDLPNWDLDINEVDDLTFCKSLQKV
ncbi:hypothetical protein [Candidatus Lokiarchaeum ossiferum]